MQNSGVGALPPNADICLLIESVRFVPEADAIGGKRFSLLRRRDIWGY